MKTCWSRGSRGSATGQGAAPLPRVFLSQSQHSGYGNYFKLDRIITGVIQAEKKYLFFLKNLLTLFQPVLYFEIGKHKRHCSFQYKFFSAS